MYKWHVYSVVSTPFWCTICWTIVIQFLTRIVFQKSSNCKREKQKNNNNKTMTMTMTTWNNNKERKKGDNNNNNNKVEARVSKGNKWTSYI